MYTVLFLLFAAIAVFLIYKGTTSKNVAVIITGAVIAVLTLFVSWFLGFWTEKLWFDQLGYNDRFWTVWMTKSILFTGTFLIGALVVFLLTLSVKIKSIRYLAVLAGALFGGFFLYSDWETILMFLFRVETEVADPILNLNTGFYLFTYPFLKILYSTFLALGIISLIASFLAQFRYVQGNNNTFILRNDIRLNKAVYYSAGFILLVLAFGRYTSRFGLMYSQEGVVSGPGWTDTNIRLPMLMVAAIVTALAAILMVIPVARIRITGQVAGRRHANELPGIYVLPGMVFLIWIIILYVVPALFQWLKVEPNEITVERPYIENNIQFTRYGFNLDNVEEYEFPASEEFSRNLVEENSNLLNNIRLWDYRALDAVFKQFQEIRLYYEFTDVDIDRYHIAGSYNEVMISAREMETGNLPLESQTFVNKRFKYTHGFGIALNRVSEFTSEGLPNLLVKDIPPVSEYDELRVTRPEIYYGEMTNEFVVVNTKEEEFDYPSGENNVYTRYEGTGGVPLTGLWRKFLFGSQYGSTRFFLSGYPTSESRIMFHRRITDRIQALAPFLDFDDDPYIVLNEGKLYWIIDAYTTSGFYPYSEPFSSMERIGYDQGNVNQSLFSRISSHLSGKNYIRNSVKITVDAYSGEVNFYTFDQEDPILRVYKRIFPGMIKDREEMPEELQSHVRYPADMLLIQGLVYAKYHMTDPAVFYNQEDLWVRSTEKYYNNVQPVQPYYIMWEQQGSDEMEFVLMLPFTPKDKQVMIGWIAGLCDGENYGRFLAYKFPKEKRILGTQQVETKIDQDSYLSGQLTLWDQRGSNVIRGNVLAIPVSNTMLYVEPIYLQSETSAYPELRLVAVMHDDNLSYAETFEEALSQLYKSAGTKTATPATATTAPETGQTTKDLISRANNAFENYLDLMQQKRFREAGEALENLRESLQQLSQENGQ